MTLAMLAIGITARTRAGTIQLLGLLQFGITFMSFSCDAKTMIARRPSTKFGSETSIDRLTEIVRLKADLGFIALKIPIGIPNPMANNDDNKIRRIEYPN